MANQNTTIKTKSKVLDLNDLQLNTELREKLNQLIEEFSYIEALKIYDIPVDNKILLFGHTGCGKTATANAIGKALNKKVLTLNLGGFVSSRLGETGKNITEIFRQCSYQDAILFIDEFDFIGKIRDYNNQDSGEMQRLVNTLIQQIDNLSDSSLLICATNHLDIIDTALLRRFQLKLEYKLPNKKELDIYYNGLLAKFPNEINEINRIYDISFAEAKDIVFQQIKAHIIENEKQKKHLLFSYGTLKLEKVQLETYGRKLVGKKATLSGFELKELEIKDSSVIAKSNTNIHPIAKKTNNDNDTIDGYIFELTGAELLQTDAYEVADYKRVLETTASGDKVWIYIAKNAI